MTLNDIAPPSSIFKNLAVSHGVSVITGSNNLPRYRLLLLATTGFSFQGQQGFPGPVGPPGAVGDAVSRRFKMQLTFPTYVSLIGREFFIQLACWTSHRFMLRDEIFMLL